MYVGKIEHGFNDEQVRNLRERFRNVTITSARQERGRLWGTPLDSKDFLSHKRPSMRRTFLYFLRSLLFPIRRSLGSELTAPSNQLVGAQRRPMMRKSCTERAFLWDSNFPTIARCHISAHRTAQVF